VSDVDANPAAVEALGNLKVVPQPQKGSRLHRLRWSWLEMRSRRASAFGWGSLDVLWLGGQGINICNHILQNNATIDVMVRLNRGIPPLEARHQSCRSSCRAVVALKIYQTTEEREMNSVSRTARQLDLAGLIVWPSKGGIPTIQCGTMTSIRGVVCRM